jgi:hypothetical protein
VSDTPAFTPRAWGLAFASVFAALLAIILWQAIFVPRLAQDWFGGATEIPAAQIAIIQGKTSENLNGFQLIAPVNRSVVLEATVPLARAEAQPHLHWFVQRKDEKAEASLKWMAGATAASQPLSFKKDGRAEEWVANADPRWLGNVPVLRLEIQTDAPITLGPLTLRADSVAQRLKLMWEGWFGARPWKMADINFIEATDATENYYFNLTMIGALLLVVGAYAIHQHWYQQPVRFEVLTMVFLVGWALSTVRWEAELVQKVALSWQRYAGKTLEEKHLAADDHEYYWVVNAIMPHVANTPKFTAPVPIHFAKTERYDTGKLNYYAAPNPVLYVEKAPAQGTVFGVINVANGYDPAAKQLILGNGTVLRAERLAERGGAAVYRAL